jgi:hypothetical protein
VEYLKAVLSLISDFLEACKNYHKGKDSSYVAQNYVDVVNDRRTWDNPDRITIDIVERELFSKYPFDWGKMNRCFRITKRNVCYELLLETIKNSADTIDSQRESRIEFVRLDSTILFSIKGSGTSCVLRKSYSYRLPSQSAP